MATKSTMSEVKMAARIYNREDNLYKQDIIKDILRMYADEVRKCMINGERVQISKVGTIIPWCVVKVWSKTFCWGLIIIGILSRNIRYTLLNNLYCYIPIIDI